MHPAPPRARSTAHVATRPRIGTATLLDAELLRYPLLHRRAQDRSAAWRTALHEGRDELRDALILFDARAVDSLFRLRGTDIHYRMPDLVYLLACYEPGIFSERAKAQIPRLASEAVIRSAAHADYRGALLRYGRDEDRRRGVMEYLHLQRRAVDAEPRAFRFEKQFVAFAQALGGGNLDETIARWHERLMHGAA